MHTRPIERIRNVERAKAFEQLELNTRYLIHIVLLVDRTCKSVSWVKS